MDPDLLLRIADRIPSMLAYWDRDLRCRYANRAFHDWFGIESTALLGRTLPELLGADLFALNRPHVQGVLSGAEQRFERDVPGPAGIRRSLAHYMPDWQDGRVVGFIAYVTDVTPLKLTQDRLKAARRRTALAARDVRRRAANLREAQRLAQVGSWEWRIAGDRVAWSPELSRIFGLDPQEAPPPYSKQDSLYLPESWQVLQQAVAATLSDGTPYALELAFRHPEGTHWIEARGEALRDGAGCVIGLRGTAHDVTWRRKLEEARVRLQVAEAANRNKTELLSRASHELRTPLNAILGFGHLLQQHPASTTQQREWIEKILDGGRHLLALTEDLLDMSAAETGQLVINVETTDLAEIAGRACHDMAQQASAAGMRINMKPVAVQLRLVRADSVRVRQIVTNLLSNAIKYGSSNTVIDVFIEAVPPGCRSLHVQDCGPGLTSMQLGLLFRPFERLGAQRTPTPGIGLGLAISRHLAELMNGRIEAHSEPGVGSRFTLVLPAAGD